MEQNGRTEGRMAMQMHWPPRVYIWLCVVALQIGCVVFFIGDVAMDVIYLGFVGHTTVEFLATLALVGGAVLGAFEVRRLMRRAASAEDALKAATAAFSELIQDRFTRWKLTPGEAEVGLLTLKGFDVAEIASLRNTASGTVRAQLSQLYAKSGTSNRGQFVSGFIDVLIDGQLLPEGVDRKTAR